MMPQILAYQAYAPRSASDAAHYLWSHLMDDTEAGALENLFGYLDTQSHVVPLIFNRELWAQIGMSSEERQLPKRLVFHLCQGMDIHGKQIARIAMYSAPREYLLTLHSEISEAFEPYPEVAWNTLRAMALAVLAELEARATLVRIASGEREWRPARLLAAFFPHGRNKEDEPHFHGHLIVFPVVMELNHGWRLFHDRASFQRLNTSDGLRYQSGVAARREAAKHGFQVTYEEGLASLLQPNGATVKCPDGREILAGTVFRKRSAMILAHRRVKDFLHVPALTAREVRLVHENPGVSPLHVNGIDNPAWFFNKLSKLELLDEANQILTKENLVKAIRRIDEAMAMAQASLIGTSPVSKVQSKALRAALESKRKDLVKGIQGLSPQDSSKSAKIKWTRSFTRVLEEVVASGREGLNLVDVGQDDDDIVLVLLHARLLCLEVSNGRRAIKSTELGELRLAEVQALVKAASEARYDGLNQIPVPVTSTVVPDRPRRGYVPKRLEPDAIEKEATLEKGITLKKENTNDVPKKNHSR